MNRPEPLIAARELAKSFGDNHLFSGLSFTLHAGEHVALIGPNGSGKSTLLSILTGAQDPDEGEVVCRRGLTRGYLSQEPSYGQDARVEDVLRTGQEDVRSIHRRLEAIGIELETADDELLHQLLAEQETLHARLDKLHGWEPDRALERVHSDFELPPLDRLCNQLSGGESRRLGLARLFLEAPELLILDEPTNHLDPETVERLEEHLAAYPGSLLFVTHDRYFLDRVANRLIELDPGRSRSGAGQLYIHEGNYSSFLEARAEREAFEQRASDNRSNLMRQELAWMRSGIKARRTRQKARVERFEQLSSTIDDQTSTADLRLIIPSGPRLGNRVLDAHNLSKSFGNQHLFSGLDFRLEKGERIGILGGNGTGKTSFLKILLGELEPDSGEVVLGQNTVLAYIEQDRARLDPEKTIQEEVAGHSQMISLGNRELHVISYLKSFLFAEDRIQTRIAKLSGGERNRVLLAKLLRDGGNVLLLDEPTNDLDLPSLRALEDALLHFPGCVLIVSHDRFFLNRVATSVLAFEGDGEVHQFDGDYEVYADWRRKRREAKKAKKPKTRTRKKVAPAKEDKSEARRLAKALTSAEKKIATLEQSMAAVKSRLEDPDLYSQPEGTAEADALQKQLAQSQSQLDALYATWEELAAASEGA